MVILSYLHYPALYKLSQPEISYLSIKRGGGGGDSQSFFVLVFLPLLQACFLSLWELSSTVVITCPASLRASLLHLCRPLSLAGVSQDCRSALSSSSLACSSLASTMLSVYRIFYLTHPDDCSCRYLFIFHGVYDLHS